MTVRLTSDHLPAWVTWLRAPNAGPMTLDGTNTWVLDDGTVIDPGPDDPAHLDAIIAAGPVKRILVTHCHPDHVEGVDRLAKLTGAAIGEVPAGVEVLRTPGHTTDSVCFLAQRDGVRVIFTGDTILGEGSSVVAWPDGDVGDYLRSLELLARYAGVPGLTGHGPTLADCAEAAQWLLSHRLQRLDQVRDALAQGARTTAEVVDIVYADVDPAIRFAADWTVRAQLAYLETLTEP